MRAFSLALLVSVSGTVARAQEPVVILENNVTRTVDCHGGTGSVNGNSNFLTFRNCATLAVNGNSNTVDAGAVVSLSVIGGTNKVTYALGADGRQPKIANLGSGNTVTQRAAGELPKALAGAPAAAGTTPAATGGPSTTTINSGGLSTSNGKSTVDIGANGITIGGASRPAPAAAAPAPAAPAAVAPQAAGAAKAPLVINDNNLHQDFDCGSGSAVVGGNGNVITLRNCAVVTVNGNDNTITTAGTPAIALNGNQNQVQWTESADGKIPRVADRGNGNRVSKKP